MAGWCDPDSLIMTRLVYGITTGGVKYHITNLLKEYGVNNRSKLINEIRKSQILTEGIGKDQPECPVVKSFLGDRNGV